MEWVFFYYEESGYVPFQQDIQAVEEQRLSGREWRRADGTWDECKSTSSCLYMVLTGRAIKCQNQLCRITFFEKSGAGKMKGTLWAKGCFWKQSHLALGWIGTAGWSWVRQRTVWIPLDSAHSRAKKVSADIFLLRLHVHAPYWISCFTVEDEEIENRR